MQSDSAITLLIGEAAANHFGGEEPVFAYCGTEYRLAAVPRSALGLLSSKRPLVLAAVEARGRGWILPPLPPEVGSRFALLSASRFVADWLIRDLASPGILEFCFSRFF